VSRDHRPSCRAATTKNATFLDYQAISKTARRRDFEREMIERNPRPRQAGKRDLPPSPPAFRKRELGADFGNNMGKTPGLLRVHRFHRGAQPSIHLYHFRISSDFQGLESTEKQEIRKV
jgi:hypothetical protein